MAPETGSNEGGEDARVGLGFDSHRLVPGDGIVLAGVRVQSDKSLEGHSDADVVLHAVVDAILGAIGAGDIGDHFPPADDRWRGACSDMFVDAATRMMHAAGYQIVNLDVTIFLERPNLSGQKEQMKKRIAALVGARDHQVNVKAKTAEGLGAVGAGEAAACQAVVLVHREA